MIGENAFPVFKQNFTLQKKKKIGYTRIYLMYTGVRKKIFSAQTKENKNWNRFMTALNLQKNKKTKTNGC